MTVETLSKQAARAAYGWGRAKSWADALALLGKAANAGEAGADQQLRLVTQADIGELSNPSAPEWLSTVSRIGACRGFAPSGFSEWLIEHAIARLGPAPVNEDTGARAVRTASACGLGPQQRDLVLAIMQAQG